jgi:aminoglycoside/choline kinase family phosphotransferase
VPKQPNAPLPIDGPVRARLEELVQRQLGTPATKFEPVVAGLGNRRFIRIHTDRKTPSSLIARIEAPEDPSIRPAGIAPEPALEPLRTLLEESGLPVPRSYGRDESYGIDLLEDLGTENLAMALASADARRRRQLISEACDWIARLQSLEGKSGVATFDRRLNGALFRYKAEQVIEWVLPHALMRPIQKRDAEIVRLAFAHIAEQCESAPQRLAHRDYQSTNLHVRPGASPGSELTIIDFQGAFLAPPEYDLVCLLQDPHAALDEPEIEWQLDRIRDKLPDSPTHKELRHRFDLLTLTRCGKDFARFLYAARARGDDRFAHLHPHLARSISRAAQAVATTHPSLTNLAELLRGPKAS